MKITPLKTRAQFEPATYNPDEHTIEVVLSTGSKGLRSTWYGDRYYEELEVSESAVRMSRLGKGAPLLDSHQTHSIKFVFGVFERAWIQDGEIRGLVRFSSRPEVAPYEQDVANGIIRNLSVGYMVHVYQKIEAADQTIPTYRAVDWEPYEGSLVTVGFDEDAQVRSKPSIDVEAYEVRVLEAAPADHSSPHTAEGGPPMEENRTMPNRNMTPSGSVPPAAPAPDTQGRAAEVPAAPAASEPTSPDAQTRAAIQAEERTRIAEITNMVRIARLGDGGEALAQRCIDQNLTIDQARAAVFEAWQGKDQIRTVSVGGVSVGRDGGETQRRAKEHALILRVNPRYKLSPDELAAARQYSAMTLMDFAKDSIEEAGGSYRGLGLNEIASYALNNTRGGGMVSTSDLPNILGNVAQMSLRNDYEATERTYEQLVRQVSAPNFKPMERAQLGAAPKLEKVGEGGEYKRGKIGDAKESFRLVTYGKILPITRQAIINDEMDALTRIPAKFGRSAAELEADVVWGIILSTAFKMRDGKPLFHADHKNLAAAAAAIGVDSVGAGRTAMRTQKGLGDERISVRPKFLVVPAALETKAEQFLTALIALSKNADANPFAGRLSLISEDRIDEVSEKMWMLAADPGQIDMIETAYLEGEEGVQLDTREGFDVDGVEIRARLDFGAAAIDHRGFYKNPGQ